MSDPLPQIRRDFWRTALADPRLDGVQTYRDSNAFIPVTADGSVLLVFSIEQDGSSVFLRGALNARTDTAKAILEPRGAALGTMLGTAFVADGDRGQGRYCRKRAKAAFTQQSQWTEIIRWFGACKTRFSQVISEQTGGDT